MARRLSFSRRSWVISISSSFLLSVGLLTQFSIKANTRAIPPDFNPSTQLFAVFIGLVLLMIAYKTPFRIWHRLAWPGYFISVLLLILVRQFGELVFGSKRWILLAGFQIQPSEFLKPALILLGANIMPISTARIRLLGFLKNALLFVIPTLMVLVQPNLGTAIILMSIWLVQLLISRVDPKMITVTFAVISLFILASYPLMNQYQKDRIDSFLSNSDISDSGYNVAQARIAIGSGGLTGNGLSGGSQSQLNFLPAQHTDFVFAVISEKLGLIGGLAVLLAEVLLPVMAWRIMALVRDPKLTMIAGGCAVVFSIHMIINIGMNLGLSPVTGIPLPLVSYGGSSVVVSLFMIGWLLAIDSKIKN